MFYEGEVAILNLMNSDNYLQEFKKDPWMTYEKLSEKGKNYNQNQSENNLNSVVDLDYSFVDVNR